MIMPPSFDHPVPAVYDVCAIGNAIVDIIAECDDAFLDAYGVTKGAMNLIDEARMDFLYAHIGPSIEMSGGSAANTAVGVAALGGRPSYIGKVRDDTFGTIFRHDMCASGVHYPTPASSEGAATARSLILVTPDAQRSMNTYLGICADLSIRDIEPHVVANAQVTYLEGYLFDKPLAQEAFYAAAAIVRQAGRTLALTLSDTFCVDRHRGSFLKLIQSGVGVLIGNEYELMSLFQVSTVQEALAQARALCPIVAATRSEKGVLLAQGDHVVDLPSTPPVRLLDSTGAGDMFAAGLLFGLTQGKDLAEAGRIGTVVAAEALSHYGPRPQTELKSLVAR